MNNLTQAGVVEQVVCPFCSLLCDDLTVARDAAGKLSVIRHGCSKSAEQFGRDPHTSTPRIGGRPATPEEAIARIAELLHTASSPLIAGLGTEVRGMRAAMSLADKARATLDHMDSDAFMRNVLVLQNSGWQTCTLTEVRNRADLLLIINTDVVSVLPRFFERLVWNTESMFDLETAEREIVYLGTAGIDTTPGVAPDGRQPQTLICPPEALPGVLACLRALVSGHLPPDSGGAIPMAELARLADRLKAAKYSVIVWAAGTLDFPHAELTVQHMTEMVKTLNETTRSSALPLSGSNGAMDANQVAAWISGYPVRTSYARGYPEHDPYHFSTEHMLADGAADLLLWISSLDPQRGPPPTALPTVVLGHPDMVFPVEPEVFVPVGVPGMDHTGIMFRTDNVVSLPLGKIRQNTLPALDSVLLAVEQALPDVGVPRKPPC